MSLSQSFRAWYTSTPVLRFAFGLLRNVKPVAVFGKTAFVTRYHDVVDVLQRQDDFTVYQIDGYKMSAMGRNFVLGMDDTKEAARDRDLLRQVIKRTDLELIRSLIRHIGSGLIADALPAGRIDTVDGYARMAAVRLVARYFGVPADEKKMMEWQRTIFTEAFVNLTNDPAILEKGKQAAKELEVVLNQLLAERKQQLDTLEDNVYNRLILRQKDLAWLDDEAVKRNIACILGVVENISKVVTHVIDQFLRRPAVFEMVRTAAVSGDIATVQNYCFEALRFNPHNPAILRFCKDGATVGKGTRHEGRIPPGTTIYAATLSAMFDPEVVRNPKDFDPDRNVDYLHFGGGPHLCAGRYITEVCVPELIAGLLRLKNLRRAKGRQGQIIYDELVFPNSLILEFDK
jgi:cytochrome P450